MPLDNGWAGVSGRDRQARYRLARVERDAVKARCGGIEIREATTQRSRLLGLALLKEAQGVALHLPRCRSVHTFGMRFALDIAFLDQRGRTIRIERNVQPNRVLLCRAARSVLETPTQTRPAAPSEASKQ